MIKKVLCIALLISVSAFFAAAGGQSGGAAASADGKLKLSAMLIQYSEPPSEDLWNLIEDKLNVEYTIDWVPKGQAYQDKVNVVLSSGSMPDIMFTTSVTLPTVLRAAKGGMFADLTPVLGDFSKWPNLKNVNVEAWKTSKVDGKNFIFPRSRGNYDMPIAHLRGDWLDTLGMEIPTTIDEFTAYLKAVVAQDMGNNGTVGATNIVMNYMQGAFGPGSRTPARPAGSGTGIVPPRLAESYALALEYWQGLYAQGLVSQEYAILKGGEQEDMYVSGKSAYYVRNIWHRKRMDNELQATADPKAYSALMFTLKGPSGYAFHYDKGYAGGLLVSSKVSDSKLEQIVAHFDRTSDPDIYNLLCFGVEGTDHNIVDGFPQLTDSGKKRVNGNAIQYPFCLATNTFQKVDSPLADAAYNLATRKMTTDALGPVFAKYPNPHHLDILQSESWATLWSQKQDGFAAFEVEVVTGKKTVDEFRAYQKQLLKDPLVVAAFGEFQKSFDGFEFKIK